MGKECSSRYCQGDCVRTRWERRSEGLGQQWCSVSDAYLLLHAYALHQSGFHQRTSRRRICVCVYVRIHTYIYTTYIFTCTHTLGNKLKLQSTGRMSSSGNFSSARKAFQLIESGPHRLSRIIFLKLVMEFNRIHKITSQQHLNECLKQVGQTQKGVMRTGAGMPFLKHSESKVQKPWAEPHSEGMGS